MSTVSFSVTGENLTNHFRDLCREGNWQNAIAGLQDSLVGISLDYVVELLKGNRKLIGDSRDDSIELVKDGDCADYLSDLDYIYGHPYEKNGEYWIAYAVVTNYGANDLPRFYEREQGEVEVVSEWMHNNRRFKLDDYKWRARFYMDCPDDQIHVLPVTIKTDNDSSIVPMVVLFKRAINPPLWQKATRSPSESWEATNQDKITRLGHVQTFGDEDEREAIAEQCKDFGRNRDDRADQNNMTADEIYSETPDGPTLEQMMAHQTKIRQEMGIDDDDIDSMNERMMKGLSMPVAPTVDEYIKSAKLSEIAYDNLDEIKAQILEQCNGKFREITFPDPVGTVKVPEQPLLVWALHRTHYNSLAPDWTPVCPMGMKMGVDNRYHTDWMVGAGIDLVMYDDKKFNSFQYEIMMEIQEEFLGFDVTVLVDSGNVVGEVIHPKATDTIPKGSIIVIPNAGTHYYEVAKQACDGGGGVIVENGGAMAHLSVVGIEERFTIIRTPNARKIYPEGTLISINTELGKVEMMASPK